MNLGMDLAEWAASASSKEVQYIAVDLGSHACGVMSSCADGMIGAV